MTCPDLKNRISFEEVEAPEPPPSPLSRGFSLSALTVGVIIPACLPLLFIAMLARPITMSFLSHPLETLAGLMLMAIPPLVNFALYKSISNHSFLFGIKRGVMSGAALGAALVMILLLTCCSASGYGGALFVLPYLACAFCTLKMVWIIRATKEVSSSRRRIITYLVCGTLTTMVASALLESKEFFVRFLEKQALSESPGSSKDILRAMNVEREERMNCADSQSGGLAQLFLPISTRDQYKLYFLINGKSFVPDSESNYQYLSDEYLSRRVVGHKLKGLSMVRSAICGVVHGDALSSSTSWTMVVKNEDSVQQDARIELALDEQAAICGAKYWLNDSGSEQRGVFARENSAHSENVNAWASPLVQDLGRGRYLITISDIPSNAEAKLELNMALPLSLEKLDKARLTLPAIKSANLTLGGEHALELMGDGRIETVFGNFTAGTSSDGKEVISGDLTEDQLVSPVTLSVKRNAAANLPMLFLRNGESALTAGLGDICIKRKIDLVKTSKPGCLVIVLDGSKETKNHLGELKEALEKAPASLPIKLMVASQEDSLLSKPLALKEALPKLDEVNFSGGQDNLKALVKASQIAGQSQNGAVLWVHGKQPAVNDEMYILSPFAKQAKQVELSFESSEYGERDYFKNHAEIANFQPLPRLAGVGADLHSFLELWQPGRTDYKVSTTLEPATGQSFENRAAEMFNPESLTNKELLSLAARKTACRLAASENSEDIAHSATLGRALQVVTAQSSIFMPWQKPANTASPAPQAITLQGSANGLLQPEGAEATIVQGVNTAGTVRVNNLANLEAVLNLFANAGSILGLLVGAYRIFRAFCAGAPGGARKLDVVTGALIICLGLLLPGTVNWFIASARDAALFN